MRDLIINPSMMCIDYTRFAETLRLFEANGLKHVHVDVMDGVFVPNYALGIDYIKKLRKMTSIKPDIHLMVSNPDDKLDWFDLQPGEYVDIHYESTSNVAKCLEKVRSYGAKAMLTLSPETPLEVAKPFLPFMDGLLLMTVHPGFAGQRLVPGSIEKVEKARRMLDENGYGDIIDLAVDGNVSFENLPKMKAAGANIFDAGTSSVFHKAGTVEENLHRILDLLS